MGLLLNLIVLGMIGVTLISPIVFVIGVFCFSQKGREMKEKGFLYTVLGIFFLLGAFCFLSGDGLAWLKIIFFLELMALFFAAVVVFLVRFLSGLGKKNNS